MHCQAEIEVERIRMNRKQQRRLSQDRIERHVRAGDFRPIDVRPDGRGGFLIAGNGRHRYAAALRMGWATIPCYVKEN